MQAMVITIVIVVVAGLAMIPLSVYFQKRMSVVSLNSQVARLEKESGEYSELIKRVDEVKGKETILAKKLSTIDRLVGGQKAWIRILETLSACQAGAGDIWFTDIKTKVLLAPDAGKIELNLEGNAYSVASIVDFQELMRKSDLNLEVKKISMQPNTAGDNQQVVKFQISYKVKG